MYTITREISFSYGHRLLHHEGKCSRLHGHNGRIRITLASPDLDAAGMVLDFHRIKDAAGEWVEQNLDHRLILHREDPAVGPLLELEEAVHVVDFHPTAENLARYIYQHLAGIGLPILEVRLDETDLCSATYRADREGLTH